MNYETVTVYRTSKSVYGNTKDGGTETRKEKKTERCKKSYGELRMTSFMKVKTLREGLKNETRFSRGRPGGISDTNTPCREGYSVTLSHTYTHRRGRSVVRRDPIINTRLSRHRGVR